MIGQKICATQNFAIWSVTFPHLQLFTCFFFEFWLVPCTTSFTVIGFKIALVLVFPTLSAPTDMYGNGLYFAKDAPYLAYSSLSLH